MGIYFILFCFPIMYIIINISLCTHANIFKELVPFSGLVNWKDVVHLTFWGVLSNWFQTGFTSLHFYVWCMKKLVSCILTNALYSIIQSNGNANCFHLYFLDYSEVFFAFLDHSYFIFFELLVHILFLFLCPVFFSFSRIKFLDLF